MDLLSSLSCIEPLYFYLLDSDRIYYIFVTKSNTIFLLLFITPSDADLFTVKIARFYNETFCCAVLRIFFKNSFLKLSIIKLIVKYDTIIYQNVVEIRSSLTYIMAMIYKENKILKIRALKILNMQAVRIKFRISMSRVQSINRPGTNT